MPECAPCRRSLILLLVVALAIRLTLLLAGPWAHPAGGLKPDSGRYLILAENLRKYHAFGLREPEGLTHQAMARLQAANGTLPAADADGLRPEFFRTPGYPAFLAAIEMFGGNQRAILLVQCILGALQAPMVVAIGLAFGLSRRGALLAGWLWALHPGLVTFDSLVLTESLFNFCITAGLFAAARPSSLAKLASAGILLGLATLVRPVGFAFLPAAFVLVWPRVPGRWLALAGITVTALLPAALWASRNHASGAGWRTSTMAEIKLLYYDAAYSISEESGEDWLTSWPQRVNELSTKLGTRLAPGEDVFAAAQTLAIEEITARPVSFARVQAKALTKLAVDHSVAPLAAQLNLRYQGTGLFSWLMSGQTATGTGTAWPLLVAAALWMLFNALLALACLVGLLRAIWRKETRLLLGCGVPLILLALATGSVGLERFRLPLLLPMLLLAGSLLSPKACKSPVHS